MIEIIISLLAATFFQLHILFKVFCCCFDKYIMLGRAIGTDKMVRLHRPYKEK